MAKLNIDNFNLAKETIKKQLTLRDYFRIYGVRNWDLMHNVRALCPIHGEDTPSFTYYPSTDTFYCFGCEAAGSVIEFHWHLQRLLEPNYSKVRGVLDLSREFRIEIPDLFAESPSIIGTTLQEALQKPSVIEEGLAEESMSERVYVTSIEQSLAQLKSLDPNAYLEQSVYFDTLNFIALPMKPYAESLSKLVRELKIKRLRR